MTLAGRLRVRGRVMPRSGEPSKRAGLLQAYLWCGYNSGVIPLPLCAGWECTNGDNRINSWSAIGQTRKGLKSGLCRAWMENSFLFSQNLRALPPQGKPLPSRPFANLM